MTFIKPLLSIALASLTLTSMAQPAEPVVKWGKEIENTKPGNSTITQVLLSDGTHTYALREEGTYTDHHYLLEQYDAGFNRTFSVDITPPVGVMGNSNLVNKVIAAKDKIIVLCDYWNKSTKTSGCNAFEVSLKGAVSQQPVMLDKTTAEKQLNGATFKFSVSEDGTKLLVLTQMPYVKDAMETARIKCFETSDFKLLWSHDIDFGVVSSKSPDHSLLVSNNADGYLFKKIKADKNIWKYALYTGNKERISKQDVDLADKVFNNSIMKFNVKNDLIIFGTYAVGRYTGNESQGTVFIKADASSNSVTVNKSEVWNGDIISSFKDNTIGGKAGSVIPLDMVNTLNRADGSFIVMFEQNKTDKTAVPGSTSFQYNYTYTSGNVLVLCIGNDGALLWHNVIPKNQVTQTQLEKPIWNSFCYALAENRLLILYGKTNVPYKWKDASGREFVKEKIFGLRVMNPTCMVLIDQNGQASGIDYYYGWPEKTGYPLLKFMEGAAFEMSLQPSATLRTSDGLIIYAEMPGQQRFKLGMLKL